MNLKLFFILDIKASNCHSFGVQYCYFLFYVERLLMCGVLLYISYLCLFPTCFFFVFQETLFPHSSSVCLLVLHLLPGPVFAPGISPPLQLLFIVVFRFVLSLDSHQPEFCSLDFSFISLKAQFQFLTLLWCRAHTSLLMTLQLDFYITR